MSETAWKLTIKLARKHKFMPFDSSSLQWMFPIRSSSFQFGTPVTDI